MTYLRTKNIFLYMVLIFTITAIAGCGDGKSSASSSDKWFDAYTVQEMYAAKIKMEAVEAGKSEADRSCEAILPLTQKSLRDSGNGMVVQIMYKICNNAGLKFQEKVRCEADKLQILCR
jgi:hypothetical protein